VNRRSFERLVARAIDRIPGQFLSGIDNLVFRVEDWADAETLVEAGFDDRRDLLGYYRGWPLTERDHNLAGSLPDEIILYHQAIEGYVAESGDPLMKVIRETLFHELAHHFGFSEEEMDVIETLWLTDETLWLTDVEAEEPAP